MKIHVIIVSCLVLSVVVYGQQMSDTPMERDELMHKSNIQTATFGAGCFWGVEAAFRKVNGVVSTTVGYSGGRFENPTYEVVRSGKTGHAEVVQVQFDPDVVSYQELLDVFWDVHNPTQLNRQGPDIGEQYRSVIFYHSPEQRAQAVASKEQLFNSGKYGCPIVTQIAPAAAFYQAEEYHQQYLEKRGQASYKF
jgi:peptide-methionine (S)-S-oxide reductase